MSEAPKRWQNKDTLVIILFVILLVLFCCVVAWQSFIIRDLRTRLPEPPSNCTLHMIPTHNYSWSLTVHGLEANTTVELWDIDFYPRLHITEKLEEKIADENGTAHFGGK